MPDLIIDDDIISRVQRSKSRTFVIVDHYEGDEIVKVHRETLSEVI
jgi:hypothetical protein